MIRITSNLAPLLQRIGQLEREVSDFDRVWDRIIDNVIVPAINDIFDSEGYGTWPPRVDDLPHPLLQLSGDLRRSLTQPNSGNNINVQTSDSLEYGSDIFYSDYHEEGTDTIPPRPILNLLAEESRVEREIEREIEIHFQRVIDSNTL